MVWIVLVVVLIVGVLVGLAWRGLSVLGDRRGLDVLAGRLRSEQRIDDATHATLAAMREAARRGWAGSGR